MFKFILGLLLGFTSFLGYAQGKDPVSWKITSEKIDSNIYQIHLEATIKKPYHIYPMQSSGGGLGMPTAIIFAENPHIELLGTIEEKAAETAVGKHLPYYAEGVTFIQKIRIKTTQPQTCTLTVKYMACNDRMCLPPAKKTWSIIINGETIPSEEEETSKEQIDESIAQTPYQDFELPDVDGKTVSSKDIVQHNTYTFVDFWASWCSPCREQGRALIPLYQKYRSKGFGVIGISLDTNVEKWKKAILADGYRWINLSDLKGFESPLAKYYHIRAIPRNYLIDQQGKIIARDLHGQALESKLIELFGK